MPGWVALLIVVGLVFALNLLPAFGPPTWTVLVYFRVTEHLPIAALVVCGAVAAASGRLALALAFRSLGSHLPERRRRSLDALGVTLSQSRGGLLATLLFFAVSPAPSNSVFEAVGLARVRLAPLVAAFLAGRLVSYSLYLTAASAVARRMGDVIDSGFTSWGALVVAVLGASAVAAVVLIDWVRVIDWVHAHRASGAAAVPPVRPVTMVPGASGPSALVVATRAPDHGPQPSDIHNEVVMFHSILAATDGSPRALSAVAVAAGIARRQGARLTVFTAVPGPRLAILPPEMAIESARKDMSETSQSLEEVMSLLPSEVSASTRIVWATPAQGIEDEVQRAHHDLVVVGSRGRGALRSTLLGSVARSVVGTSSVPVLVVKSTRDLRPDDVGGVAGTHFGRILVAIDGTEASEDAVELAARLAHSEGATLTVLTAISVRRPPGMPESALVRLEADAEEYGHSVLDAAVARVGDGTSVSTVLAWGEPETAIPAQLQAGDHDLLVIGSRGRGKVGATLLGSLGYAMLARSTVPVLIARPPARHQERDIASPRVSSGRRAPSAGQGRPTGGRQRRTAPSRPPAPRGRSGSRSHTGSARSCP